MKSNSGTLLQPGDPVFGLPRRFWDKVEIGPTTDCWLWTAGCFTNGYGQYRDGLRKRKAHIVLMEALYGPCPAEMEHDHTCLVKRCVSPYHVERVTHAENAKRSHHLGSHRRRNPVTHCQHGHEFTPENTYRAPNGKRACRECNRIRCQRAYRQRIGELRQAA